MLRIRVAILLLGLGLSIPGGLLVTRALSSVALEREVRERAVSERILDEMERNLTRFLEVEEGRPFEHYRFYLEPPGTPVPADSSRTRSPLAEPPAMPFVVGYFQVDPDGGIQSPRVPPPDSPAAEGWSPPPDHNRRFSELGELVSQAWRTRERSALDKAERARGLASSDLASQVQPTETIAEEESTAYDVLKRLNLAGESRSARKQKTQYALSSSVTAESDAPAASSAAARSEAEFLDDEAEFLADAAPTPGKRAMPASEIRALEEPMFRSIPHRYDVDERKDAVAGLAQTTASPAEKPKALPAPAAAPVDSDSFSNVGRASSANAGAPGRATAPASSGALRTIRVLLDPMSGLRSGSDHLVLYRTVVIDRQGVGQGLVIDLGLLADWLRTRVLEASDLSSFASVAFSQSEQIDLRSRYRDRSFFAHRFAEPFEAVAATVALAPLPGAASAASIYALAAVAIGAVLLGLIAVDRMTGLALGFAERRNNFVAAVSHELKTPLTAIRMYAEMLRDGLVGSEDKRAEYYATITDESERLSRLVDNVLEFSRLEQGRRQPAIQVGDLAPVVREVAETLSPHARRNGFEIQLELEAGLPAVRYDRDAVVQTLFNLVDNALKYANGCQDRRIVLGCKRVDSGVCLDVRDYGPGVSRRHLGEVFEPFYRGQEELTRTARGTGIGLALVKELATSMDATVQGQNADGGGFQVTLTFTTAPS